MSNFYFRAWDIERKKMIYPDGMYGDQLNNNTYILSLILSCKMNDVSDEFEENYILMQFTDRYDVNNRKIYEDDILLYKHQKNNNKSFIIDVCWIKENGVWGTSTHLEKRLDYFSPESYCVIIGNRHETPHLINDLK